MLTLRNTLSLAALFVLSAGVLAACSKTQADTETNTQADLPTVTVYKSPACGCCSLWAQHLEENGFPIKTIETTEIMAVKEQYGVPGSLTSCHTAVVDGYALEGHVPADVIKQLLAERPAVAGLAVAGMPAGSPGMEGPNKQSYDVMAFTKDGQQQVYARR